MSPDGCESLGLWKWGGIVGSFLFTLVSSAAGWCLVCLSGRRREATCIWGASLGISLRVQSAVCDLPTLGIEWRQYSGGAYVSSSGVLIGAL